MIRARHEGERHSRAIDFLAHRAGTLPTRVEVFQRDGEASVDVTVADLFGENIWRKFGGIEAPAVIERVLAVLGNQSPGGGREVVPGKEEGFMEGCKRLELLVSRHVIPVVETSDPHEGVVIFGR